jgi:hypothetical protein
MQPHSVSHLELHISASLVGMGSLPFLSLQDPESHLPIELLHALGKSSHGGLLLHWSSRGVIESERRVGVAPIVGIERGEARARLHRVVISELKRREVLIPIIMVRRNVASQNLFDRSVGPLRLAISLGMVSSGHIELSSESLEQLGPEGSGEPRVPVGDYLTRHTMQPEHSLQKDIDHIL